MFNGPVFRSTDQKYRGVQIPREFWKLVVFTNDANERAAAAFVLTQADLIEDLKEEFRGVQGRPGPGQGLGDED